METVNAELPSALLRAANLEGASFPRKLPDCWRSNLIGKISSRWDAPPNYARRRWLLSWISSPSMVSRRCDKALKIWTRSAGLLTVSKCDCSSGFIAAVILTKLGCFDLLNRLFRRLDISAEVYHEVVVAGADLPGATEVANAK
jgi:hypothetical protein